MQDWGVETDNRETIDDAVDHIKSWIDVNNGAREPDPTIDKLLSPYRWRTAITSKEIMVTNAVWGLRPKEKKDAPNKMCGYLGAKIHKRAFLTWGKLVALISSREKKEFRLLVAGEWARFDNQENKSGADIKDYLNRWRTWASKYTDNVDEKDFPDELSIEEINKCKGHVIFLSHPCTWNSKYESDPFD